MDDYDHRVNNGNGVVLPPKTGNRVRRVRAGGNGLSGSARYPVYSGEMMDAAIRHHEQEAYFSVLKAFKVQSNALSWEKEELITELRRELRVSDEEHREILRRVNDSLPPFCKKQKISTTSGNRGDASHLLRDINSIESAQYYSTGPTRRGVRGGVRSVRGVKRSMDHNNNGAVLPLKITKGNIEMVLTETVIDVVEKVLLSSCPNPLEIEHAANLLKNQEESLVCALRWIADASEGEYANNHDSSIEREQEQHDINGQPALGAENGMITDGEGGGNVEQGSQGSHESSKVGASIDDEDV